MNEQRGNLYLLTGVILGIAFGLLMAWVISPVRYVDTAPESLRADYKDAFRSVIAAAYAANGDIGRAAGRLALLNDNDPAAELGAQAQRMVAANGANPEARALALLSVALSGQAPGTTQTPAGSPIAATRPVMTIAPSLTPLPSATATLATTATRTPIARPSATRATPLPTLAPTATPGLPFVLDDRTEVCGDNPQPLLQVEILDAAGQPVPGVEVRVTWQGGEDRFFTGLKPERGAGYADFLMTVGVEYSLRLVDGGVAVEGLSAVTCEGSAQSGGWLLVFTQP